MHKSTHKRIEYLVRYYEKYMLKGKEQESPGEAYLK